MDLIVACDAAWGIGCNDQLLLNVKEDMMYFRQMTTGRILLYGRKTLMSFPGQKPLPNRRNIILSRNKDLIVPGAEVIHQISEISRVLTSEQIDQTMVIGGASVYKTLLPYCDTAYVTHFDTVIQADAFFPDLGADSSWHLVSPGDWRYDAANKVRFRFAVYRQDRPSPLPRY